jgi:hypothetical protein
MALILLRGNISLEDYSQTEVKITSEEDGIVSTYYINKKSSYVYVNPDSMAGEYVHINQFFTQNQFYFPFSRVVAPVTTFMNEFLNIVNGWFYGGSSISLNGGSPISNLGTLNFIEGTNVTITETYDAVNNRVDITISASGGGGGGVPTSRTLTINGTSYDLSANRTWNVGTVTSVGLSMPSAFVVSSTPVTGSGTLTVVGAGTISQYIDGTGALQDFKFSNLTDVHITTPVDGDFIRYNSTSHQWENMAVTYVANVTATLPISSSGGSNPDISISQATTSTDGYLSSTDWNVFNNKADQVLTTKGDLYTFSTVPTRLPKGLDTQILSADSSTTTGLKWISNSTPTALGYYGSWQDGFTQSCAASNTGYPMIFRTTDLSNGISIVTDGTNLTKITFANTGIYNLQFSSQFQNADNALHDVTIWLRKNGTTSAADVAGTAGFISIPQRKSIGDPGHTIAGWNYVLDVVGGDYYQLIWSTTDHTTVTMEYYPAGSPPPAAASVILTVTQQAGIMAGTGMTALNGLSGAVQTFATGTTGTDFGISSSGTTHTFNLPTASATNRGLLSTTDWTTFNNKQSAITTGTTAQYIRGDLSLATFPTIPSVGTWGALNYPSWVSGTPFVKMTAVGTFSLDTNTYLTSVGTGTTNELTYWSGSNTLGSLSTSTYPSLTELSYVKGTTSSIQTQLGNLGFSPWKYRSTDGTTLYSSQMYAGTNGTFTIAATATLRYMPLLVEKDSITINRLGIYVLSASAAGTKCRLGIYNATAGFRPNALLLDAGEVAINSTGQKTITGLSTALTRGLYFLAILNSAAGSINSVLSSSMPDLFGTSSGAQNATSYFSHTQTYGSLPSNAAALTSNNGNMPAVYFACS